MTRLAGKPARPNHRVSAAATQGAGRAGVILCMNLFCYQRDPSDDRAARATPPYFFGDAGRFAP